MNGRKEAEKIDVLINTLILKIGVNSDNAEEWLQFTSMLKTGLDILEREAKRSLDSFTENVARKKSGFNTDYKSS